MSARSTLTDLRFVACVVLVCATLIGGGASEAILMALLIPTVWILVAGEPRWLPLLYLLHLPSVGFSEGSAENELGETVWSLDRVLGFDIFANVPHDVILAGVQVNVAFVACLIGFGRAALFNRPWPQVRLSFRILCIALVFAVISSALARDEGLNRWSQSVRFVMTVGAFYWGTTFVRRTDVNENSIDVAFVLISKLACLLLGFGILRGHLIFLSSGIVAASLPLFYKRRMWPWLVLGLAGCAISFAQGTLTMRGIMASAVAFSLLSLDPTVVFSRLGVRTLGLTVAATTVLSFVVVMSTSDPNESAEAFEMSPGERGEVTMRARDKLLLDRAPIWHAAWTQITTEPYVFVPAARPFWVKVASGSRREWTGGSHNVPLEIIRNIGIPGGLILLIVCGFCYVGVLTAMTHGQSLVVRVMASAVGATMATGFATGNFPIEDSTGVLLWSLGGVCFAAAVVHRSRATVDATVAIASAPAKAVA